MPDKDWYKLISIHINLRVEPDDDDPAAPAQLTQLEMQSILNSDGQELKDYRTRLEVPNEEDAELIDRAHAIMDMLGEFLVTTLTGNTTQRVVDMMRNILQDVDEGRVQIHENMGNYKRPDHSAGMPEEVKNFLKSLGIDVE